MTNLRSKAEEIAKPYQTKTGQFYTPTLVDRIEQALKEASGCDHLDAPYRRLLKERDDLKSKLQEAEKEIERREELRKQWSETAIRLEHEKSVYIPKNEELKIKNKNLKSKLSVALEALKKIQKSEFPRADAKEAIQKIEGDE